MKRQYGYAHTVNGVWQYYEATPVYEPEVTMFAPGTLDFPSDPRIWSSPDLYYTWASYKPTPETEITYWFQPGRGIIGFKIGNDVIN